MKIWILILALLLFGCASDEAFIARDVEKWVLAQVPYTEELKCGHRSLVAICMLESMNYDATYEIEKCGDTHHAYVHWEKNEKEGDILRCD